MFGLFSKDKKPDFVYDQAVIVGISLESLENLGSPDQRASIKQLEAEMDKALPQTSGIDGDEFGDGQVTIYMYGPSADKIFEAVKPILRKSDFNHIDITLQYGLPDDPKTNDKKFTL